MILKDVVYTSSVEVLDIVVGYLNPIFFLPNFAVMVKRNLIVV